MADPPIPPPAPLAHTVSTGSSFPQNDAMLAMQATIKQLQQQVSLLRSMNGAVIGISGPSNASQNQKCWVSCTNCSASKFQYYSCDSNHHWITCRCNCWAYMSAKFITEEQLHSLLKEKIESQKDGCSS